MRTHTLLLPSLLLGSFLVLSACTKSEAGSKEGGAPTAGVTGGKLSDAEKAIRQGESATKVTTALGGLQTTLAGISDGPTATAAKGKLETLIADLKTSLGELSGSGNLMESVSAKFGANKDQLMKAVSDRVGTLMGNEQVKAAIGPVLEQLQSLLK